MQQTKEKRGFAGEFATTLEEQIARMLVPKLVKNGFNSSFGVLVSFEGMDSEWITETVANGKK
jgi:hypothetical protein